MLNPLVPGDFFTFNNIKESWYLLQDYLILFKVKIPSGTKRLTEGDTKPLQTSKMELFVTLVNGFKPLTIIPLMHNVRKWSDIL